MSTVIINYYLKQTKLSFLVEKLLHIWGFLIKQTKGIYLFTLLSANINYFCFSA